MKTILKNTEKYSNIKLAKGLLLDDSKTIKRAGECGVSTGKYGLRWFCLPKGKAIFKTYDGIFCFDIRQNRIINELVCKELCNQVGIECPEIEPASKNGVEGIVSYNVAKNGKKLINAIRLGNMAHFNSFSNSIEDYAYMVDELEAYGYKIDKQKFVEDMYKICIFDFITMQTDRHECNMFFIKYPKTREITVAPLIDNEFAFCGKKLISYISKRYINIDEDIKKTYQMFANHMTVKSNFGSDFDTMATEIVNLAKNDKNFDKILKNIIDKLDIKNAIKNVEKMGYEISPEYKEYLAEIVECSTKYILNKYKEIKPNKSKYNQEYELLY